MPQVFGNNSASTLAVAITSAGQTALTLASGASYPVIASPDWGMMTLTDGVNTEIVKIIAHASGATALTVTRAQEGTTAQAAFAIGTKAEMRITAGFLNLVPPPAGTYHRLDITTSQTWTVPARTIGKVQVTVQAAGGSGNSTTGGGAGAFVQKLLTLTPGAAITVTVGAATASLGGGSSSFGAYATVIGGSSGSDGGMGGGYFRNFGGTDGTNPTDWFGYSGRTGNVLSTRDVYYVGGSGGGDGATSLVGGSCGDTISSTRGSASMFGLAVNGAYGAGGSQNAIGVSGVVIVEWYEGS